MSSTLRAIAWSVVVVAILIFLIWVGFSILGAVIKMNSPTKPAVPADVFSSQPAIQSWTDVPNGVVCYWAGHDAFPAQELSCVKVKP